MEFTKDVAVELLRATDSALSALSNRALSELWGQYSCETHRRLWVACNEEEARRFFAWAAAKTWVCELVARARQSKFKVVPSLLPRRPTAHHGKRYIQGSNGSRLKDLRVPSGNVGDSPARRRVRQGMMNKHELIDSLNLWCEQNFVGDASTGGKGKITPLNLRYMVERGLIDPPGCPASGRLRGYTPKHALQLRIICLFQARSWSLAAIYTHIDRRSTDQLLKMEREELALRRGDFSAEGGTGRVPRTGSPKWA